MRYFVLTLTGLFCASFSGTLLYYLLNNYQLKTPFSHPFIQLLLPIIFLTSLIITGYSAVKVVKKLWHKYMLN